MEILAAIQSILTILWLTKLLIVTLPRYVYVSLSKTANGYNIVLKIRMQ